ncbi:MAG TPA: SgcJ/EcaC family oxidoreductase, partial [Candidatus Binatia bacterium]|nr:SgcJ/EcaC family oxidoreductase [Candidatus Binatia bacterium]
TLLAAAALLPSFFVISALAASADDAGVRNVVAGFATAWNNHDMDSFGKLFALDADFVNVTGILMKGRHEIQSHHAWSHGTIPESTRVPQTRPKNYGIFKNSAMKFDTIDVRFLRNDVALAHVDWQLSNDARTSTPRRGVFLFVLNRGKEGWQIAAAQNTEINRTVK